MTMLDTVKKAKRIKHSKLDDEIARHIETAKAELIRAGADEEVVNAGGSLVTEAVVTFCLMKLEDDLKEFERYERSFGIQLDQIRRSHNVQ
ncbi:MAG: hypothetical protein IJ061_06540 [Lachnospiraceae bacterium]|nr:hypothetical protein [Lachnospiraceae bacterium]